MIVPATALPMSAPSVSPRAEVAAGLVAARQRTLALTDHAEDVLTRQHSPLLSPLVWDLAHIGAQEDLWLLRGGVSGPGVLPAEVEALYDASTHPRAGRGALPLLDDRRARDFLAEVRARVLARLAQLPDGDSTMLFPYAMVAAHEHQHDETMLLTHGLRKGDRILAATELPTGRALDTDRVLIPAGPFTLGVDADDEPWSLDNERPGHTVTLPDFAIGRVPVTNGEWDEFIADGGYGSGTWWSAAGWRHRMGAGLRRPLGWHTDGSLTRYGVRLERDPAEPVQHICYYEAEAYAAWRGARLPTEAEWEKACAWDPEIERRRRWPWGEGPAGSQRANLGGAGLGPAQVGAYPAGASAYGVEQMIGDVWEWTSSTLTPWPRFAPMLYDTYSVPFFGADHRVLRGGSWAAHPSAVRPSFRNWDLPVRRQITAGLRLAWDVP